jgi:acetyltransferase-like isoleucine patch superfamily enzyme
MGGGHHIEHVSSYPFAAIRKYNNYIPHEGHQTKGDITIRNDVWIGMQALILSNITIGDGAVISARSVVSKDVPPYAVVAGNPAKVIKYRFKEDVIEKLINIAWWNWDDQKVLDNLHLIVQGDIEKFISHHI